MPSPVSGEAFGDNCLRLSAKPLLVIGQQGMKKIQMLLPALVRYAFAKRETNAFPT